MRWLKQLFCKHEWVIEIINEGYYDQEVWLECTKCHKQKG